MSLSVVTVHTTLADLVAAYFAMHFAACGDVEIAEKMTVASIRKLARKGYIKAKNARIFRN